MKYNVSIEKLNELKELKLNEKEKIENIGKYIREIEDDVDNLNKELERLNDRKKKLSNKIK
jgi:septal ring factor EnvC (AmiA/AmiB activator)